MKRNDTVLLGTIILIALLCYGGLKYYQSMQETTHKIAVITQNNKVVERIDLDTVTKSREIKLRGNYHETIRVEKGRIRFKEADCPDKICVNTGWLRKTDDIAVCIPNRVIVKIED
ncbi:MAG: NusG domain II-containing protein [Syntrophomonas sp.]